MKNFYYRERKNHTIHREPKTERELKHWRRHGMSWQVYYKHETSQIMGYIMVIILLIILVAFLFTMEPK